MADAETAASATAIGPDDEFSSRVIRRDCNSAKKRIHLTETNLFLAMVFRVNNRSRIYLLFACLQQNRERAQRPRDSLSAHLLFK